MKIDEEKTPWPQPEDLAKINSEEDDEKAEQFSQDLMDRLASEKQASSQTASNEDDFKKRRDEHYHNEGAKLAEARKLLEAQMDNEEEDEE